MLTFQIGLFKNLVLSLISRDITQLIINYLLKFHYKLFHTL